ncbi:MAG: phage major capsid protein, partial [Novosphingobium sp.]|nr:phage major capsid protein [Novosphingobium sp.]
FAAGEIYANPAITQRLLDDAHFNIEQWLADQLEAEFNKQETIAFISGDGTNKPRGLLTYVTGGASETTHPGGVLTVETAASATAVAADELVTLMYNLAAPYRQNATWLMNSVTGGEIARLKDANGAYIWRESFMVGQPPTLLGRPVEFDEAMPSSAAGLIAIAFGDFKSGYLINDRIGSRILRDPYTNKPFVQFYATKRVGGGVADPNAIRLLKMAAV